LFRFYSQIRGRNLWSTIGFIALVVGVTWLLPDHTIDRLQIFNPRKFGYLILTLAGLEFCSYALIKYRQGKENHLVIGFLGGLISSTAVVVTESRKSRFPDHFPETIVAANLAALAELLLIALLLSTSLFWSVLPAFGACLTTGVASLWFLRRRSRSQTDIPHAMGAPPNFWGVMRLALIMAAILAAVALVKRSLGSEATYALVFVSGFFELHGVTYATSTLYNQGDLTLDLAKSSLFVATTSSFFAKSALMFGLGERRLALKTSLILLTMTISLWAIGVAKY